MRLLTRSLLPRPVAACAVLVLAVACAGVQPVPTPIVVLIVVDTLRRDSLGCYGHPDDPTPAIDALARDGTRFERAISSSGWTLPAMVSLLTGTWPSIHKALGRQTRLSPISEDVVTGTEVLQQAGFRTLAVANAAFVSPSSHRPSAGARPRHPAHGIRSLRHRFARVVRGELVASADRGKR